MSAGELTASLSVSKSISFAVGGILLFAGLYLLWQSGSDPTGMSSLYLLGVIQISPLVLGITRNRPDYLGFVLINHFTVFTVNRINVVNSLDVFEALPLDVTNAIHELIICTLLMIASHTITRWLFLRPFYQANGYESMAISWERKLILLGILISFPFCAWMLPSGLVIPVFSATSVLFILLFTSHFEGNRNREFWVKTILLASAFHHFVETGFMTLLGQYAGVTFVASCLQRKARGSFLILLLVPVLAAIQSIKNDYRMLLVKDTNMENTARVTTITDLLGARYFGGSERSEEDKKRDLAQGFSRVGDASLELVLNMTPSQVPFWGGSTYETIPYMFIPRFLWPDKPRREFWNKFGHLYGQLSEEDDATSVGVGFLAEAYMNFGFGWLYTLSLLFGVFLVMMERFAASFFGGRTILTFLVFLMPLMAYASDLGSMLSSLLVAVFSVGALRTVVSTAPRDAYGVEK